MAQVANNVDLVAKKEAEKGNAGDVSVANVYIPVEYSNPPIIEENAFNPAEVLGVEATAWVGMLEGLSPKLPVQIHCEPHAIKDIDDEFCQPLLRRTVQMLNKFRSLDDLMAPLLPNGTPNRVRLKFRLSTKGKFIHRNRYPRRQIICCLNGEQWWLFISAYGGNDGGADNLLDCTTNDNWNGFRSKSRPTMLTLDEMQALAAAARSRGADARVVRFKAGDVMAFDGRWWHATSYEKPVLNMFFTPGKDMETAVKEHHRRMAMPMQKGLKLSTISLAKCSKLSPNWQTGSDGKMIDWDANAY